MKDIRMETTMLIGEIMVLAHLVNENTDYCVFVDYAGHVGKLSLRLCESKSNYTVELAIGEMYTNEEFVGAVDWQEEVFREMKLMKLRLRKILRDKKVDYSQLEYINEYKCYII